VQICSSCLPALEIGSGLDSAGGKIEQMQDRPHLVLSMRPQFPADSASRYFDVVGIGKWYS
jgi:hypothetical protein